MKEIPLGRKRLPCREGTPTENDMKKGGLEDTDQKSGDGQKEGGWVPFDTVPEDNRPQLHCKEIVPFSK